MPIPAQAQVRAGFLIPGRPRGDLQRHQSITRSGLMSSRIAITQAKRRPMLIPKIFEIRCQVDSRGYDPPPSLGGTWHRRRAADQWTWSRTPPGRSIRLQGSIIKPRSTMLLNRGAQSSMACVIAPMTPRHGTVRPISRGTALQLCGRSRLAQEGRKGGRKPQRRASHVDRSAHQRTCSLQHDHVQLQLWDMFGVHVGKEVHSSVLYMVHNASRPGSMARRRLFGPSPLGIQVRSTQHAHRAQHRSPVPEHCPANDSTAAARLVPSLDSPTGSAPASCPPHPSLCMFNPLALVCACHHGLEASCP